MKKNGVYVYDIETLCNAFTYTAKERETGEVYQFVIWKDRNDYRQLLEHLASIKGHIGFNNVGFDYPVLHAMIQNQSYLMAQDGDFLARWIYDRAQNIISQEFSSVREDDVLIPQLDLFLVQHYNNKARITSLKKLQIAMNSDNVMDMPIHHTTEIATQEEIDLILEYNLHDVDKTLDFYKLTEPKVELRRGLIKKYGLNCMNYSDSKIGEELMLKLYCESTGKDVNKVRRLRTKRDVFKFSECIPSYINFTTPDFNELLTYLRGIEVTELKDSFKYSFEYNGFVFDLGTGGIHGSIKSGVYESDNQYVIVDADVESLYPSLAITLGIYPEHLGEEFGGIYENELLKPRLEAKKLGDKVMDLGFKLSLNSVYGKSNSEFSWLYDPLYTIKTTLSGQLALCMLSEMLMTQIPDLTMIQINTDGLTVKMPAEYGKLYWDICKEWERITALGLEYVGYTKMIIRDVNSYIAVAKDGKVKRKGVFKQNEEMRKDGEYHKSFSQGIVKIALSEYFLNDKPVEETIRECKDVFEFTKMANSVGKWWTETFEVDSEGNEFNVIRQQKNNRYLLTNSGVRFRKCVYKPDKETGEDKLTTTEYEADRLVTILNKYEGQSVEELDINYDYYIEETYKIIHLIDGTTERLEAEKKAQKEKEKREREEANFVKYCINKIPTVRQMRLYGKEYLIEKYISLNKHETFWDVLELIKHEDEKEIT